MVAAEQVPVPEQEGGAPGSVAGSRDRQEILLQEDRLRTRELMLHVTCACGHVGRVEDPGAAQLPGVEGVVRDVVAVGQKQQLDGTEGAEALQQAAAAPRRVDEDVAPGAEDQVAGCPRRSRGR
jgi:hypothetical protein